MDFNTVLYKAQQNGRSEKREPVRYYSTKFEPPKKEQRSKRLSVNVQKFLARKEAEEKLKQQEADMKKEKLLSLRAQDRKATRRVNVMIKRTKSANQSAIVDAVDKDNTSVTLAGPSQPDEDDYGYVSQEAAAYYNKLMEKYNKMPNESTFNLNKKNVSTNLSSTKDRVMAAIEREKEEMNKSHKGKRKNTKSVPNENQEEVNPTIPLKKTKCAAPPQIKFTDLLKIAEKKQFEPIIIEQKPKEEEKLLTKKQKKELEREKEWRERKEAKTKDANKLYTKLNNDNNNVTNVNTNVNKKLPINENEKRVNAKYLSSEKLSANKIESCPNVPSKNLSNKRDISKCKTASDIVKSSINPTLKRKDVIQSTNINNNKSIKDQQIKNSSNSNNLKQKESIPKQKQKEFIPKQRQFPQFPQSDLRRIPNFAIKSKNGNKRRILDDESDYDSEMDDFIDDGPIDADEDYSKQIKEIFGYDKSKYRDQDDNVDNMESSFAQQMREEVISSKIGRMEDLEDMRKEEEEKKLKMLKKKKMKF